MQSRVRRRGREGAQLPAAQAHDLVVVAALGEQPRRRVVQRDGLVLDGVHVEALDGVGEGFVVSADLEECVDQGSVVLAAGERTTHRLDDRWDVAGQDREALPGPAHRPVVRLRRGTTVDLADEGGEPALAESLAVVDRVDVGEAVLMEVDLGHPTRQLLGVWRTQPRRRSVQVEQPAQRLALDPGRVVGLDDGLGHRVDGLLQQWSQLVGGLGRQCLLERVRHVVSPIAVVVGLPVVEVLSDPQRAGQAGQIGWWGWRRRIGGRRVGPRRSRQPTGRPRW